jgi:hypothetical protein
MINARLTKLCFWIAVLAGLLSIASIFFAPARSIVYPATLFVGATAALLFLKMLFTRTIRRGVDAANREMQGDDPWPGKPKKFRDPEWGLFGSRTGTPTLFLLRAVLSIGILPLALIEPWIGTGPVVLWLAGAFVAIELGIIELALPRPRQ